MHNCTFNHNYYQKTLSYMGLGLCNLKKTTEIRICTLLQKLKQITFKFNVMYAIICIFDFMNFISFIIKFIKFKPIIKFRKFELHHYGCSPSKQWCRRTMF